MYICYSYFDKFSSLFSFMSHYTTLIFYCLEDFIGLHMLFGVSNRKDILIIRDNLSLRPIIPHPDSSQPLSLMC